jgi:hypothetical protein
MSDLIPIWLTNRDLLTPVMRMVDFLSQVAELAGPITIVDCDSTYPPLLEWYEQECPLIDVTVIRAANLGPRAPWRYITDAGEGYFFISDADLDLSNTPPDFLRVLRQGLIDYPERVKVGLSLQIDALPDDSPITERVRRHEIKFWTERVGSFWSANIDTTAAVYRLGEKGRGHYGPALRSAPPYMARHLPWYVTPDTLTEEWRHFLGRSEFERVTLSGPALKGLLS